MKNERLNQLLLVVNCLRKHNKNCNQTIITKAADVYITKKKKRDGELSQRTIMETEEVKYNLF